MDASHRTPPKDLKALTSLRFFAAMMIVAHHMSGSLDTAWLQFAPASLVQGVSFFFVLSGFILTHVYRQQTNLTVAGFMSLRVARLYPTHLAAMILMIILTPWNRIAFAGAGAGLTAASFLLKLLMLDSLVPIPSIQFGANGVSWSLSTEMFFYLAFPFLLPRLGSSWPIKLALAAVLAITVYALPAVFGMPVSGVSVNDVSLAQLGFTNPLARVFEFVLGMSCYLAWRRWVEPIVLSAHVWTVIEIASAILIALWLGVGVRAVAAHLTVPAMWLWFSSSGSCVFFAVLIMVFASARGALGALLTRAPMVWLGQISFAIYIYHQIAIRALSGGVTMQVGADIASLVVLAAVLALAAANHRWVEGPGRRLVLGLVNRLRAPRPRTGWRFSASS